jgi:hypothetical protein
MFPRKDTLRRYVEDCFDATPALLTNVGITPSLARRRTSTSTTASTCQYDERKTSSRRTEMSLQSNHVDLKHSSENRQHHRNNSDPPTQLSTWEYLVLHAVSNGGMKPRTATEFCTHIVFSTVHMGAKFDIRQRVIGAVSSCHEERERQRLLFGVWVSPGQ